MPVDGSQEGLNPPPFSKAFVEHIGIVKNTRTENTVKYMFPKKTVSPWTCRRRFLINPNHFRVFFFHPNKTSPKQNRDTKKGKRSGELMNQEQE